MNVGLLITCLTDTFYPRVGEACVYVLRRFGCRVEFPARQTCCGQPAYNSGFHAEAACLVRHTIAAFAGCEYVVTPSASCATLLKEHGPELLPGAEHAGAVDFAGRVWEFNTFLRDKLGVRVADLLAWPGPVTYHYPCHARGCYALADLRGWLGGAAQAGLLREPEHPDQCCGFGGLFAVDFPEVSGGMVAEKLDVLAATGAELVICNEAACALQLSGAAHRRGLPLRFEHLAERLAASLGWTEAAA